MKNKEKADLLFDYKAICEAIFNHSTEAIIIANERADILHANPTALRLFEYELNELINHNIGLLVPHEYRGAHQKHVHKFTDNPHPRSMANGMDLFGLTKSGKKIPISASLSPALVNGQKITITLIIDITELKDSKDKLKSLNQELEKKVHDRTRELASMINKLENANTELESTHKELESALEKEKELNELKTRFVSMASHEFRTPLSTILSSVSLLKKYGADEKFNEKRLKHYERVSSNVRSLTNILNDFLSLDKLQDGNITCYPTTFDLKELCLDSIDELDEQLKENQKINLQFSGNPLVKLDKNLLKNSFLNLLSNAIKYSEKEIFFTVDATEYTINIRVKDQGIGIPEDDKQHMFERFFRAKNVINIQGTGLGLTIVKRYLDLMNGSMTFESEYEKGTEFIVTLPRTLF